MAIDIDYVKNHFNPVDQRLVGEGPLLNEGLHTAIDLMLEQCPVVKSDGQWFGCPEGGWVVNSYEDVMDVVRNTDVFSNRVKKGEGYEPPQIPIDVDPPELVEYKRFLRPYFTMTAVSKFEDTGREIITELLDKYIESGRCDDVAHEIAYPFSTKVQWTWLIGVDETDHAQVLDWILTIIHKRFETELFENARSSWIGWLEKTLSERRNGPRQDDLIDGLFHKEFQGRPLTDDEVVRMMEIMIIGGVTATADAITNILLWLAVYPKLQDQLRADRELLPQAIEEFLRIEPPVTGAPRKCLRDTVVNGQTIKAGDQLFVHNAAANRDPAEFENPHELDFHRERNRHLTFGAGHHRCLGSNFARMNLRIVFEEILDRMHNIRLVEDDPPSRIAGIGWMVSHLPLAFDPGPKRS